MYSLVLAVLVAQPGDAPPLNAPPVREVLLPGYFEAQREAEATGRVLVVFLGAYARPLPNVNAVLCSTSKLEGYDRPGVIVTKPGAGHWYTTLGVNASDIEIARTVDLSYGAGREVQAATPPPFVPSKHLRAGEVLAADDDEDISGQLTFLKDLEPYVTAKNTQHTQRRDVGYIEAVPRSTLKAEWLVPGGLEHAVGWKSRLLKNRIAVATVFLDRPDGDAVLWSRSYPDGSVFADELRNAKGKVVEVRVAEKRNGIWDRFVAYKNHAEAPPGFRRFKSNQCSLCHDQAGHAAYGAGAIPGADGILSDPIPIVEAGGLHQDGRGTQSNR